MSEKSHVTMEQHRCIVCGQDFDTGNILLDTRLREVFDHKTVVGMGLCPEHQDRYDQGYIALVECDPARSKHSDGLIRNGDAYRTGTIVHMKLAAFQRIITGASPFDDNGEMFPMVYVEPDVVKMLKEMAGEPT